MASVDSVRYNSLAHVLAAAEANKSGTAEKWKEEQQAAIEEACKGGTPISCETAVAAMGSVMAWPLLPEAMAMGSLIGAGANAGVGYAINGEVNPNDVILAYWTGGISVYTVFWGTVGINAAGGATSNYLKGDDPVFGAIMSGTSAGLGYGAGKGLEKGLDKVFNPAWKNWTWTDIGMGISKPTTPSMLLNALGSAGGGLSTEVFNDQSSKALSQPNKER